MRRAGVNAVVDVDPQSPLTTLARMADERDRSAPEGGDEVDERQPTRRIARAAASRSRRSGSTRTPVLRMRAREVEHFDDELHGSLSG